MIAITIATTKIQAHTSNTFWCSICKRSVWNRMEIILILFECWKTKLIILTRKKTEFIVEILEKNCVNHTISQEISEISWKASVELVFFLHSLLLENFVILCCTAWLWEALQSASPNEPDVRKSSRFHSAITVRWTYEQKNWYIRIGWKQSPERNSMRMRMFEQNATNGGGIALHWKKQKIPCICAAKCFR